LRLYKKSFLSSAIAPFARRSRADARWRSRLRAERFSRVNGDGGRLFAMINNDVAEILKLPAEERMRLVEMIWESLVSDAPALPLSDAHRTVLDERLAKHERNPYDVATRAEVLAEARRG
jgi:putative addiction module component (TIGR02574 family)